MDKLKETLFKRTYNYEQIVFLMEQLNIKDNCYDAFRDSYFALLTVIKNAEQMTEYKNWIYQAEEWGDK